MTALELATLTRTLAAAGCVAPADEAEQLVAAARGDPDVLADLASRRTRGEPLAWLTGGVDFCGMRVSVAPGVYVPRAQTEPLALRASALLPPAGVAVDLCTGAGAVAAVLAAAAPAARVIATELDPVALECARRNGVEAREGHLDDPLPPAIEHRVDVLTAVVPYVPTEAIRLLPRDVQAHEPRLALDGGLDGTDLLREVVRRSPRWLRRGGRLLVELGGDQAAEIAELLRRCGFGDAEVMIDDDGDPRAIHARLDGPGGRPLGRGRVP